jgi:hypothetical protein
MLDGSGRFGSHAFRHPESLLHLAEFSSILSRIIGGTDVRFSEKPTDSSLDAFASLG